MVLGPERPEKSWIFFLICCENFALMPQSVEPPLKEIKSSPTKEELKDKILELKKQLKTLKQKLNKGDGKITYLKGVVESKRGKPLISHAKLLSI